jgi:molybdopterin-guanine dinucleotide biosynthesis protein B
MRVFAVSGYSRTGKTSLVEQIIKTLCEQGYVVVTAKSSMHDAKEVECTDTWKHMQAGAKTTAILGPHSTIIRYEWRKSLLEIFANTQADFLIVEGMKESEIPKIWCIGDAAVDRGTIPKSTKAVISWASRDTELNKRIPFLKSNEIEKIVEIVKQEAMELTLLDT